MHSPDVAHLRLVNQRIAGRHFSTPEEVVSWLGAVQAQDYPSARWAVGLRMKAGTDDAVARAYDEGRILRTHILRPTWHFVTREDIRWMLALSAPQVRKAITYYGRQIGIDETLFQRSNEIIARALKGRHLTRKELAAILKDNGIDASGMRAGVFMSRAEVEGTVCSGPMRGKQFTYALLDERVPQSAPLTREESLAALAKRYFDSHGPATLDDFVWWSGLNQKDARTGLSRLNPAPRPQVVDGRVHWFPRTAKAGAKSIARAYLLPIYDAYSVGYTDRSALFDATRMERPAAARPQSLFWNMIIINGRMVGTWRRTIEKGRVHIDINAVGGLTAGETRAITDAAKEYGSFVDLPVVLEL